MNDIGINVECEVSADAPRRRFLYRVGTPSELPPGLNSVWAFDNSSNERPRCDEFNKVFEERLVFVLFVVLLRGLPV